MAQVKLFESGQPIAYGQRKWLFWIIGLALLAGFALSYISWKGLCSQACAEGHKYLMYGMTFEIFGFIFFIGALIAHFLSLKYSLLSMLTAWMVVGALGAEVEFIYLQKYQIGHWCPVCLAIAGCIAVAATAIFIGYIREFKTSWEKEEKDQIMKHLLKGLLGTFVFIFGFLFAFFGVAKLDKLQAAENNIKQSIAFGDARSPVEVYIFTDWACPACRSIESRLEEMAPSIMKKAKVTFVDFDVHPETLNFIPYNLSFMVHNKPHYLKIRRALTDLSIQTDSPSEHQIEAMANSVGAKYQQLNYADVALGIKYYKHLINQFKIEGTPTVAIINRETKKGKKLSGTGEITEEKVMKAIDSLTKK